jgi:translation initiation factor 2B subunit (eIF-2B alpha/beta/delta family)
MGELINTAKTKNELIESMAVEINMLRKANDTQGTTNNALDTTVALLESRNSLLTKAVDAQIETNRELDTEISQHLVTIRSQQVRLGKYASELIKKDELIEAAVDDMKTVTNSLLKAY